MISTSIENNHRTTNFMIMTLFIFTPIVFYTTSVSSAWIYFSLPFCVLCQLWLNNSSKYRLILYGLIYAISLLILSPVIDALPVIYQSAPLKASTHSAPFILRFNADKCFVALCLLPLFLFKIKPSIIRSTNSNKLKTTIQSVMIIPVIALCSLIGLGVAIGFLIWDFKVPEFTLLWLMNMLFVCCNEELIYRGIIQNHCEQVLQDKPLVSLILASVIFGLMHQPMSMQLLASLAGLFYGRIYQVSRTLAAPIALHYLINSVHFFCFSYPRFV